MLKYSYLNHIRTFILDEDMRTFAKVFLESYFEDDDVDVEKLKDMEFRRDYLELFGETFAERFEKHFNQRMILEKGDISGYILKEIAYTLLKEGMTVEKVSEITTLAEIEVICLKDEE